MAQTREGALKIAAARVGLSLDGYLARVSAGMKRCTACKQWLGRDEFASDSSRHDQLTASCLPCRRAQSRRSYVRSTRPKPPVGRRFVEARDNDRLQARRRVNYLVELGLLPNPNDVTCTDCGHIGPGPRHEYDHFQGYGAANHELVEAVCSPCHHARERGRSNVD